MPSPAAVVPTAILDAHNRKQFVDAFFCAKFLKEGMHGGNVLSHMQ